MTGTIQQHGRVFKPTIIAHDVGRSRDRSTAVVGGNGPFGIDLTAIIELHELPQGLYGSPRASALAAIDRQHHSNALIVADLSNDPTYAEALYETFGPRVIGLQISRHGDGMQPERRPVKQGSMLVYTIGRSYLLKRFRPAARRSGEDRRWADDAARLPAARGPRDRAARERNRLHVPVRQA